MAQETMVGARMSRAGTQGGFLAGIEHALAVRGTPAQRVLCMAMMAILTVVRLPGGGYCCQVAMFAVLLRLGFCVPAAFAGTMGGFVALYATGNLEGCWQLPACTLLWLSAGLWARRESRLMMAAATGVTLLTAALVTGVATPLSVMRLILTAATGAGLSVLYDGAALCVRHREELDGDTRPLCVMAVCASLAAGLAQWPGGAVLASALAAYLTLEHAYTGGTKQALLCAGIVGGVVSAVQGSPHTVVMLLCGGFLAGEIAVQSRWLCALLNACGMVVAGALLGGDVQALHLLLFALPGVAPFVILSGTRRAAITNLIERETAQEATQSEAVAVRGASMVHAWAKLYGDTARMMDGLCDAQNPVLAQCVRLLERTGAAAHQVCERTLSEIRPDDETFRRLRYALVRAGREDVRPAYALRIGGRMEVMLLKPEAVSPASLLSLVSGCCGVTMRAVRREDMLGTQAVFEQAPALTLEVGTAARSRSGEEVAGDSYLSRVLPGGRQVLALSDGMGSGVSARQESHAALTLLAGCLSAGYTRAQALDMVNALMLMCTGREMYATMDLLVCDLHSGETAFEKLGACVSYVVREGEVRAIGADTLPVGVLPDVESRSLRMKLLPGDVVVMLTDGVTDAFPGGEDALREAIARMAWLHPQAVGEKLLAQCAAGGQAQDDMTVLCARVSRRTLE